MALTRILIADDERSIRTLLRACLATEGYEIEEAADGQETLDAITRRPPPDIVLLDLSMPAPQGMEVLARLKFMVVRPRPRVIVLTANGSITRAIEALKLGAVDFLEKPCGPEQLLLSIRRAIDQKVLAEATTPEGYAAALTRARRSLVDGHTAKAESYLRAASRLAGHDAEYFSLLGLWHELNDRRTEALAVYQLAAEFDRQHGPAQDALRRLSVGSDSVGP